MPAILVGLSGWFAGDAQPDPGFPVAPSVQVPAGIADFAQPGEFLRDGRPVAAPVARISFDGGIEIMRDQVSVTDYDRCVAAAACKPADAVPTSTRTVPVTGVSYLDAQAYADWYSRQTGETWRLPTAAEWAYSAAERFVGDVSSTADDPANPAKAWIRRYREEAERKRVPDPEPKTQGHYGANSFGVVDLAGNVWEWTSTCYVRATVTPAGEINRTTENCGVHVVEGRHRAYMSNFIRDGKSGGCAVGTPPENLGFRLVREHRPVGELPPVS
jgi:formylglycine-generating enzyme required for sulfatase activity